MGLQTAQRYRDLYHSSQGADLLVTLQEDLAENDDASMQFETTAREEPRRLNYHDISLASATHNNTVG